MPSLIDLVLEGRSVQQASPWPRAVVDASVWNFAAGELARGRWSLAGLWGEPATVHMAILDEMTAEIAVISLDCPDRSYPSVGRHHPPALRPCARRHRRPGSELNTTTIVAGQQGDPNPNEQTPKPPRHGHKYHDFNDTTDCGGG